jgi:hypothetical protein
MSISEAKYALLTSIYDTYLWFYVRVTFFFSCVVLQLKLKLSWNSEFMKFGFMYRTDVSYVK